MAADTFSSILGILLMGTGNDNNSWGTLLNSSDLQILEQAIAGSTLYTVTGGTLDLSTSPPPAGPTLALSMILQFGGSLVSNQVVVVPNISKVWLVFNGTSANGNTLTMKTLAGTPSPAIPSGGIATVFCDGQNNIGVGLSSTLRDVQWAGADGTQNAPGLSFSGETGSGLRRAAAGDLRLVTLGSDNARYQSTNGTIGPVFTPQGFLAQKSSTLTLGNNNNNDISLVGKSTRLRITGPSNGFNINGFAGGSDGVVLRIFNNSGQTGTLTNSNTGSSAANRILTCTGASVSIPSPGCFQLGYDASLANWILESHQP